MAKVQKGVEMLKKRIMAALVLIASEDLNAMRFLLRSISELTSKPTSSHKRD